MEKQLQWSKNDNEHFTQFPTDFLIKKEKSYWTLTYHDTWSVKGKSFFIRTSGSFGDRFTVKELKELAQKEYLSSK
jgi:hypothetical protein